MVRDTSTLKTFLELVGIFSDIVDQATAKSPFSAIKGGGEIACKLGGSMAVGIDRLFASLVLAYMGKVHGIPPLLENIQFKNGTIG